MSQDIDLSELGNIPASVKGSSTYKKVEFIDLPQGQSVIRLFSTKFFRHYVHYLNNAYVLCLEDECPICKNNFKLMTEFPDNFREVKGWSRRNERYAVNVLDRTMVKICPSCGTEIKKESGTFPAICTKKGCNAVIANVPETKLDKVKVISKGPTFKDQIVALNTSVLDDVGNPIPITNYDITVNIKGTGKETVMTLIPYPNKNEPVDIDESKLYDLTKTVLTLTAPELVELQQGISVKDILAARKAGKPDVALESANEAVSAELQEKINKLMAE
jgi:hypothetical protein